MVKVTCNACQLSAAALGKLCQYLLILVVPLVKDGSGEVKMPLEVGGGMTGEMARNYLNLTGQLWSHIVHLLGLNGLTSEYLKKVPSLNFRLELLN